MKRATLATPREVGRVKRFMAYPMLRASIFTLKTIILSTLIIHLMLVSLGFLSTSSVGKSRPHFLHLSDHCQSIPPITAADFHQRQIALSETLRVLNASSYIAEPGANTAFYANVSQSDWTLSERPLLLIIGAGNGAAPKISILTPKFESTRAKKLMIPADVQYIEWREDENPYSHIATALSDVDGIIYVDDRIRKFIPDGLESTFPNATVLSAPEQIKQLRERKSRAEIDIMKCVNEATLLAIRAVHRKLHLGIRESEARAMMAAALSTLGLKHGSCLTLFGENAALPHGSGTDRTLSNSDFALFDCTASLYGYYSDITRTVALPESNITTEHINIWNHVHAAQETALNKAYAGVSTGEVDEAVRSSLASSGYGSYFTHRLGHGIGLEVHEAPYLRGGSDAIIQTGHTFSDEPGIYIEGKVGVRLEDCFFISHDGSPTLLTQGVGGRSMSPWEP